MTRLGKVLTTLAVAGAFVVVPVSGHAQVEVGCGFGAGTLPCPTQTTVSATVTPTALMLVATNEMDLGTIGLAELTAGTKTSTGPLLTVAANTDWKITVRSTFPFFSRDETGSLKPSHHLAIRNLTTDATVALTTTATDLAFGSAGEDTVIGTQFISQWSWNDQAGVYRIGVHLTISPP